MASGEALNPKLPHLQPQGRGQALHHRNPVATASQGQVLGMAGTW